MGTRGALPREEIPVSEVSEISQSMVLAMFAAAAVIVVLFNVTSLFSILFTSASSVFWFLGFVPLILVNVFIIGAILVSWGISSEKRKSYSVFIKEQIGRLTGYPGGRKVAPYGAVFGFLFSAVSVVILLIALSWALNSIPGLLPQQNLFLITLLLFMVPPATMTGVNLVKIPFERHPEINVLYCIQDLSTTVCLIGFLWLWPLNFNAIASWLFAYPPLAFIGGVLLALSLNFWIELVLRFIVIISVFTFFFHILVIALYVGQRLGVQRGVSRT
jgi:hypothetical protein